MRKLSKAREARKRKADKARQEFRDEHWYCFACSGLASDIHEICRGGSRAIAYEERCTWLRLCRGCHREMDDYTIWPIECQYALKKISDAEHYDRIRCNEIRGRDAEAITEGEVESCLEDIAGSA